MTINNLDIIKTLLKWEDANDFYFTQILRRKKENPDNTSNNTVISTYCISSMESLEKLYPEMVLLAKFHNARVYINLNRRNYEQLGLQMIKKVADCLMNKAYKDIRNTYDSICGSFHVEKPKKWVIDTDGYTSGQIQMIQNLIIELGGTVYEMIPTVNGMHLITNPFNTQEFGKKWIEISAMNIPDIQKNNPTLLYYSDEDFDTLRMITASS
jgi:hypothetical protein